MNFRKGVLAALTVGALGTISLGGCGTDATKTEQDGSQAQAGNVGMSLTLPDDSEITSVGYTVTGPNGYSRTSSVPVGNSTILTFRIGGIPIGNGYSIALSATTGFGNGCVGSANFNILDNATTRVSALLICGATDNLGDLIVDGEFQSCPVVTAVGAIPGEVRLGGSIALSSLISHGTTPVVWSGAGGTFATPAAYNTTFTCGTLGAHTLTVAIDHEDPACTNTSNVQVICSPNAGCGNGLLDLGEGCDDGNPVNTDACTNACQPAVCGDGIVGPSPEECDDGNGVNTDACSNSCLAIACGNSRVDPGEGCDGTVGCNPATCQPFGCGDGVVTAPEQCDDSNAVNTDACTTTCQSARCGDGFVRAGTETCDDGNTVAADGCENDCTATPSAGGDIPNQLAACRTCRANNCTAFQGALDLVAACFNNPDPVFVQQCIDVKNCAYSNDCGYNATGAPECFCGTVDLNTCQGANQANGPCRPEWYAAVGSTQLADVIGRFSDVSRPSGVAYYFQECDRDSCVECQPN